MAVDEGMKTAPGAAGNTPGSHGHNDVGGGGGAGERPVGVRVDESGHSVVVSIEGEPRLRIVGSVS